MNKSAVFMSLLLISTYSFGFGFSKHHQTHPLQNKLQGKQLDEDFSGNWTGVCQNEQASFTIKQNATQISFIDRTDEEASEYSFKINTLETHNSSSTSTQATTVNDATLVGNSLSLASFEFTKENEALSTVSFEVRFTKQDDTLTAYYDEEQHCEFKKESN